MADQSQIGETLQLMKTDAPAGFALAFHVRYSTPTYLFQTYPRAWADYYSQNGLVMSDPTVAWAFTSIGTHRWSDMADEDQAGVLTQAAEHGLKYGVSVAVLTDDSRSMASFARADREFTDAEAAHLHDLTRQVHDITKGLDDLSPETSQILRKMSVHVGASPSS